MRDFREDWENFIDTRNGNLHLTGDFRLSGNELKLAVDRAIKYWNRNY